METASERLYGCRHMTAPLRRVLVRPPQREDVAVWRAYGWRAEPDFGKLEAEHEAFRAQLAAAGAEVVVAQTPLASCLDAVYVYDPALVSDRGAILLRPGKDGRRLEVDAMAADLVEAGVPIAGRLEAPACAEGGDTLWLDENTLLVGRGYRTNDAGIDALRRAVPDANVIALDLPHWRGRAEVMHLMSLISPLDVDLAVVYPPLMPTRLVELLEERGVRARRGAGRRVRVDGRERARARPASRPRTRGEPGNPASHGGGRCRRAHLRRRRPLAQRRRRADVPDPSAAPLVVERKRRPVAAMLGAHATARRSDDERAPERRPGGHARRGRATRWPTQNVGSAVVLDHGRLIGIVTERDLLRAMAGRVHPSDARVREWMTADPVVASEATTTEEAARTMLDNGFRHLPVVDGDRTLGIVSLRDVVRGELGRGFLTAGSEHRPAQLAGTLTDEWV